MNWEKIRKKNPKAIDKMENWLNETKHHFVKKGQERLLYDFFDENEIFCSVYFDVSLQMMMWEIASKEEGEEIYSGGGGAAENRRQGENTAFLKAFEILEEKL